MTEPTYTTIVVPYRDREEVQKLLQRFSTGFDGGTDGATTKYRIFNLDVSALVLALALAEGKLALQMQYPNFPDSS